VADLAELQGVSHDTILRRKVAVSDAVLAAAGGKDDPVEQARALQASLPEAVLKELASMSAGDDRQISTEQRAGPYLLKAARV